MEKKEIWLVRLRTERPQEGRELVIKISRRTIAVI